MKKTTLSAAAIAMAMSMGAAKPAHSQDLLLTITGLSLLAAGGIYLTTLSRDSDLVTSANTDYALTGRGAPVGGQNAQLQRQVSIECNPNGSNCRTITTGSSQ